MFRSQDWVTQRWRRLGGIGRALPIISMYVTGIRRVSAWPETMMVLDAFWENFPDRRFVVMVSIWPPSRWQDQEPVQRDVRRQSRGVDPQAKRPLDEHAAWTTSSISSGAAPWISTDLPHPGIRRPNSSRRAARSTRSRAFGRIPDEVHRPLCPALLLWASSIDVDARVTPLDPPGKSDPGAPNGGTAELCSQSGCRSATASGSRLRERTLG